MADPEKILKQLEKEFEHIKTYSVSSIDKPVYFACNMNTVKFRIVSIYLDSEIGGYFTIDEPAHMEHVCEHFDATQAEDLIDIVIGKVQNGEAIVMGDMTNVAMH